MIMNWFFSAYFFAIVFAAPSLANGPNQADEFFPKRQGGSSQGLNNFNLQFNVNNDGEPKRNRDATYGQRRPGGADVTRYGSTPTALTVTTTVTVVVEETHYVGDADIPEPKTTPNGSEISEILNTQDTEEAAGSPDSPDAADIPDKSDISDASDAPGTPGITNVADTPDAAGMLTVSDTSDTLGTADTADIPEPVDVPDMPDEPSITEIADMSDIADTAEQPDIESPQGEGAEAIDSGRRRKPKPILRPKPKAFTRPIKPVKPIIEPVPVRPIRTAKQKEAVAARELQTEYRKMHASRVQLRDFMCSSCLYLVPTAAAPMREGEQERVVAMLGSKYDWTKYRDVKQALTKVALDLYPKSLRIPERKWVHVCSSIVQREVYLRTAKYKWNVQQLAKGEGASATIKSRAEAYGRYVGDVKSGKIKFNCEADYSDGVKYLQQQLGDYRTTSRNRD